MKHNTKVFEGLFDKFGADTPPPYDDILLPIKRELERFLSSRQKSKGKNLTCIASDYGLPETIWEKGENNRVELQKILTERLQQLDPRCKNIECEVTYEESTINLTLSTNITTPWQREPVRFVMQHVQN